MPIPLSRIEIVTSAFGFESPSRPGESVPGSTIALTSTHGLELLLYFIPLLMRFASSWAIRSRSPQTRGNGPAIRNSAPLLRRSSPRSVLITASSSSRFTRRRFADDLARPCQV